MLGQLAARTLGALRAVGIVSQPPELGSIDYCNLSLNRGRLEPALARARETGRPIIAVFAEFPG
jgi:hypothetical protein